MNESFTSWDEILFGVPHGSILGPLLFNILICNLFITIDDINIVNFLVIHFSGKCGRKTFLMVYQ